MKAELFRRVAVVLAVLCAVAAPGVWGEVDETRGLWIERADGRFLNLFVQNNQMQLHFFDREKKPMKPDVRQAVGHYTPQLVNTRETVPFVWTETEEGVHLATNRFVRPPFNFHLILVLMHDATGQRTETYAGRVLPQHEVREER